MQGDDETVHYDGPAGGWGSVRGMARIFGAEINSPAVLQTLARQNKPGGFACVSCSWAKPAEYRPAEFCENGAKATLWEQTRRRCTPDFFARHTLTELRGWRDYDLEQQGRLTHPLRYDRASDRYVACSWTEAFAAIGSALKGFDPKAVALYTSGRAALEASYCYALFGRLYGTNNMPDCSNMCHETTSVALQKAIGVGVGTAIHDDLANCDAMFFFGHNTGTSTPRLLHDLEDAVKRGCKIVTFNPIRERGLERFTNPQNPLQMLTGKEIHISSQYHQVKTGGDIAAILGLCKHVLAQDDLARVNGRSVLARDFIEQHTHGFAAFEAMVRGTAWSDIEAASGLDRAALQAAGQVYVESEKTVAFYGMGLTQHVGGSDNVTMLINLLLLKGNIGRDGTGICPVRGHSNVQGQRTVGISEKPELVPLDRLAEMYDFEPPRWKGFATVETCQAILEGKLDAFVAMGGNFLRAIPERDAVEAAWPNLKLTVSVATKLNRSHLLPGQESYVLPCLGRSESDVQESGPQVVTIEDTFSCIHGSVGKQEPASEHLLSELAIVAGIAKATLPPNPRVEWDRWVADYGVVRDRIEDTYPQFFEKFNERLFVPGGFYRGNSARERIWKTKSGKAEFTLPKSLSATGFEDARGRWRLMTLRSNDQFNTTIYGYSDRMRGVEGTRDVLLINPRDMERAGLRKGQVVTLVSDAEDGKDRTRPGVVVTPFDLPDGCIGTYYPEANPLMPLSHHDAEAHTPAAKAIPVRIRA